VPASLPSERHNQDEDLIVLALRQRRTDLKKLHDQFYFGEDLRKLQTKDLETFDEDLRLVMKKIDDLKEEYPTQINNYLDSVDAILTSIYEAREQLYDASHILENQGTKALSDEQLLRQKYKACYQALRKAFEYIKLPKPLTEGFSHDNTTAG